jgi:chemotaxis regulatin CheY-phosphate phosphatase CheZ
MGSCARESNSAGRANLMGKRGSLTAISEAEYESIEAAVMETERGRWFLSQFALRNRTADTKMLLEAISRLEQTVTGERVVQNMDRVRFNLMEMAKAIARTKGEIAAIQSPELEQSRLVEASESLDGIVRTTERATSEILDAAEHVQEAAWTLREKGADEDLCGELDRRATEIYTACSFQDLTAQRTSKIVNTLRYLEGRINAMIDIWGADEQPDPAPDVAAQAANPTRHEELSQGDVDSFIVAQEPSSASDIRDGALLSLPPPRPTFIEAAEDISFIEAEPELSSPQPDIAPPKLVAIVEPAAMPAPDLSRLDAFAEIEGLDTREKLRRFT